MKTALIIFVHTVSDCTVKTGRIKTISRDESAHIHARLFMHTFHITQHTQHDKFVFVPDENATNGLWKHYTQYQQQGDDAAAKIKQAFETVFELGYSKAVMISSDNIEMEQQHIDQAFYFLDSYDIVLGPLYTAGFCLIGCKAIQPLLSINNSMPLQQALQALTRQKFTYHLLQVLTDVEEEKEKYLLQHRQ